MKIYTNADDGMIYGVPFRLDCKLFFYNTDIFNQYGLTAPNVRRAAGRLPDAGRGRKLDRLRQLREPWAGLHQRHRSTRSAAFLTKSAPRTTRSHHRRVHRSRLSAGA